MVSMVIQEKTSYVTEEPVKEQQPVTWVENPKILAVLLLITAVSMYIFLTLAF